MDTLNPIVISHIFVSIAVVNTAQTAVKRARSRRQHVLYVEAVTPRTTKVAIIIKNNIKPYTTTIVPMSHKVIHQTSTNNNQQSVELRIKPMHKQSEVTDHQILLPTRKSSCPYLTFLGSLKLCSFN